MPSAEYSVYVPPEMVPDVEAYCTENDVSASEAFKQAMRKELDGEPA